MELKEYQIQALSEVKEYLDLLSDWKKKAVENPDFEIDFPEKAWEKIFEQAGRTRQCLVPTMRERI